MAMSPEEIDALVHPDDIERINDLKRNLLETSRGHETASPVEYRVKCKNGSYRWISDHYTLLRDADGRPLFSVASARDITGRVRADERIKTALREKELLLKEIHHRVKNNMQVICALLELQSQTVESELAREAFRESGNRIRSMARIHEHLYRSRDLAWVGMATYIRGLVTDLWKFYGAYAISVKIDANDVMLDIDRAVPCGLLINGLVSNAMKHAFATVSTGGRERARSSEIRVALRPGDDQLELTVSDNGVGMPADLDLEHPKTLGLRLVGMLTRQLGGTLHVDRAPGGGTVFKITFPAPKQRS